MVKPATVARNKSTRPYQRLSGNRPTPRHLLCMRCRAYRLYVRHICQYGNCTEFYCDTCGRYSWGAGPAICDCDRTRPGSGGYGHKTKGEQPRLPVKAKGRR